MFYITSSWDDGHKLDLKLANILSNFGLKGTFYISKNYLGDDRLQGREIIEISKEHELGSHTVGHPDLVKIDLRQAIYEMSEGKKWLENILNKKIKMFSYPFGHY